MDASGRHATDLFLIANDILEKLYQQRHGFKSRFYYSFNPDLPYLSCDGSEVEQFKLLQHIADMGMVGFKEESVPSNLPDDFLSSNVIKYPNAKTYYVIIKPDSFNEQFELLKKYRPTLKPNGQLSLPRVIEKIGKFRVHENYIISYDKIVIELEPQQSKIMALIMLRSKQGQITSLATITDECLSEKYKQKVSSKKEDAAENLIRRYISQARPIFKHITRTDKNYFINKHGEGYMFNTNK